MLALQVSLLQLRPRPPDRQVRCHCARALRLRSHDELRTHFQRPRLTSSHVTLLLRTVLCAACVAPAARARCVHMGRWPRGHVHCSWHVFPRGRHHRRRRHTATAATAAAATAAAAAAVSCCCYYCCCCACVRRVHLCHRPALRRPCAVSVHARQSERTLSQSALLGVQSALMPVRDDESASHRRQASCHDVSVRAGARPVAMAAGLPVFSKQMA